MRWDVAEKIERSGMDGLRVDDDFSREEMENEGLCVEGTEVPKRMRHRFQNFSSPYSLSPTALTNRPLGE